MGQAGWRIERSRRQSPLGVVAQEQRLSRRHFGVRNRWAKIVARLWREHQLGSIRGLHGKRRRDRREVHFGQRARCCETLAAFWRARAVEGADLRKRKAI